MDNIIVHKAEVADHRRIVAVMPDWWGGRDLTAMLPRLFLEHFHETTFIAESGHELVGFLVGFFSQTHWNEGYIHFCGIHPGHRGSGLGARLYQLFFKLCLKNGRTSVRSCTSPVNRESVSFHQHLGFELVPGDTEIDGMPVHLDYNRPEDSKVCFRIQLPQDKQG